jgi:hypothetical protein
MAIIEKPTALNQDLTDLIIDEYKTSRHYAYFFISIADKTTNNCHGATVKGVTIDYVNDI